MGNRERVRAGPFLFIPLCTFCGCSARESAKAVEGKRYRLLSYVETVSIDSRRLDKASRQTPRAELVGRNLCLVKKGNKETALVRLREE